MALRAPGISVPARQSITGAWCPSSGRFFVAGPDSPDLPGADLLDRSTDDWENLLPHYSMVVQNYRMISSDRRLLWKPGGPKHSISAVGRDGTGAILFILCREPITGVDFGALLLALPIDVRVVMYTEGGSLAGLFLRTPVRSQICWGVPCRSSGLPEARGSAAQRHRCPAQIVMCLPSCGKAAFWSPIGSNGFNARRAQVRRSASARDN